MDEFFRIGDFGFQVEMGVIISGIDPSIGATAARDGNRLSQLEAQALFNRGLHALGVRLDLVAVVADPVVGQMDEITWHRFDLKLQK